MALTIVDPKHPTVVAGIIFCRCGEHKQWILDVDLQICCFKCKRRYKFVFKARDNCWERVLSEGEAE